MAWSWVGQTKTWVAHNLLSGWHQVGGSRGGSPTSHPPHAPAMQCYKLKHEESRGAWEKSVGNEGGEEQRGQGVRWMEGEERKHVEIIFVGQNILTVKTFKNFDQWLGVICQSFSGGILSFWAKFLHSMYYMWLAGLIPLQSSIVRDRNHLCMDQLHCQHKTGVFCDCAGSLWCTVQAALDTGNYPTPPLQSSLHDR